MKTFTNRLIDRIKDTNSHLCVGLDIRPEAMNDPSASLNLLKDHSKKIIDATHDITAAYKPNLAFFERWGSEGFKWLEETVEYIGDGPIIIGDAKRGDIGNTAKQYAISLFDYFGFDAVTVNPYMGSDSIRPFIDNPEKGIFILCRTSNPSSAELQDRRFENANLMYEEVAHLAVMLNKNKNIGLVVGATAPEEIRQIRKIAPNLPFLIPGIGAQGGDLEKSMQYGNFNGAALINVSRGIGFAGDLSEISIREAAQNYVTKMRAIHE